MRRDPRQGRTQWASLFSTCSSFPRHGPRYSGPRPVARCSGGLSESCLRPGYRRQLCCPGRTLRCKGSRLHPPVKETDVSCDGAVKKCLMLRYSMSRRRTAYSQDEAHSHEAEIESLLGCPRRLLGARELSPRDAAIVVERRDSSPLGPRGGSRAAGKGRLSRECAHGGQRGELARLRAHDGAARDHAGGGGAVKLHLGWRRGRQRNSLHGDYRLSGAVGTFWATSSR